MKLKRFEENEIRKVVSLDKIPIEVCRFLVEIGVKLLIDLFNRI